MAALALAAIGLAIWVAMWTFAEPRPPVVKMSSLPITGSWIRKANATPGEMPPGSPAQSPAQSPPIAPKGVDADPTRASVMEVSYAKFIKAFSVPENTVVGGAVHITLLDGASGDAKVLECVPGRLLLNVPMKGGTTAQVTIAQMGDDGPLIVTDNLTTIQFERVP